VVARCGTTYWCFDRLAEHKQNCKKPEHFQLFFEGAERASEDMKKVVNARHGKKNKVKMNAFGDFSFQFVNDV
jgi:hypothetical protein